MKSTILINQSINGFKKNIISVDGDKSLSIRFILLSSLSTGKCVANNLLKSEDVISAINNIMLSFISPPGKNYADVLLKPCIGYDSICKQNDSKCAS